jgi:hypothetical protein
MCVLHLYVRVLNTTASAMCNYNININTPPLDDIIISNYTKAYVYKMYMYIYMHQCMWLETRHELLS